MKKNLFYYLFAVICSVSLFASCSDDDDKVVNPVGETTFTDANGLQLTYSGATMLGKKVIFTPNAADATKATLTLAGELDLSSLFNRSTETTPAPGVIPGEVTTTLNVENMIIDGDKVLFEGADEKNGRTVKYKGEATSSSLKLDLTVTMPVNALAGSSFTTIVDNGLGSLYYNWVADEFPFFDGTWDMNSAIGLTLGSIQIDGQTIPQLLAGILNKVTFLPDGNIQAEYKDALTDAEWKTSDLNIAMYSVSGDKIYLYLNPSQIAASVNRANRAIGLEEILSNLIPTVLPMLSNGIPLSYSVDKDNNNAVVYLDTETILPILKVVSPMFEDEEFVNNLIQMLTEQAGELGYLVGMLKPVFVAIPQTIATTKVVQFGLKLTPEK